MIVPEEPPTTKVERNRHTRYLRNTWVRRRGVGDLRICDYLDMGFGTPERPIVVEPVHEDYVEPTRLPMAALRLLACEYARLSGTPGFAGRGMSESENGNLWSVSTTPDKVDEEGNIIVPRMVRLYVERGYYRKLDLENAKRRAVSDLAEAGKRLKGLSRITPRGDDVAAIEHKRAQMEEWTAKRDAAEAEVARLQAEVDALTCDSYHFPLNPDDAEWMVRS